MQNQNGNFWLVEMSEASTGGVLWKKMFLKISQNSQGITCAKVSFLINLQVSGNFLQNSSGRLLLKFGHWKNELKEIDCLCCRGVDIMLLASAKILGHEESMSPSRFYEHLPESQVEWEREVSPRFPFVIPGV